MYCTDEVIQPVFNKIPKMPYRIYPSNKRGKTWEHHLFIWKVKNRDNNECVICGNNTGLQVHHLNSYANYKQLRYLVDNGITLCKECHSKFHEKYGYTNNFKSQYIEFLNKRRMI